MNWKRRDTYVFRVRSGCRRWHWSLNATGFRCVACSSSSPGIVRSWAPCFRRCMAPCTNNTFAWISSVQASVASDGLTVSTLSTDQAIPMHLDLHLHLKLTLHLTSSWLHWAWMSFLPRWHSKGDFVAYRHVLWRASQEDEISLVFIILF